MERGNINAYAWYNRALRDGREVLATGDDSSNQMATTVWWYNSDTDTVYCFNRHFGIMERSDLSIDHLINFLITLESEPGMAVLVRGCDNK